MASAALTIDQENLTQGSRSTIKDTVVKEAIIFVKRNVVKSVVSREVQKYGINKILTVDSPQAAIKELADYPKAMLVIDWEYGETPVVQVLQAAQGQYKVDTRPIYFLAAELSPKLVSIASDYNIVQLHIGEITPQDIKQELMTITSFGHMSELCLKVFQETAMLRSRGEWKKAEVLLTKLLEEEPGNIRAGLELADNYFETGDYDAASDIVDKMIALDPENMRALHLHARILLKRGDREKALALLEDLCERGALNLDRMIDLGRCLMDMDQVDEASKRFDEALQIDEGSKRAKVGKSQCELLQGNINEAVLLMRQVANEKEIAAIFNNTAILCMRRKRFEKGFQLYKAAMSQVGRNPTVQARVAFNMGIGFLRWGKRREACLAFSRAAELDPDFDKARHNMEVLNRQNLNQSLNSQLNSILDPSASSASAQAEGQTTKLQAAASKASPEDTIMAAALAQAKADEEQEQSNAPASAAPQSTESDVLVKAAANPEAEDFGTDDLSDALFDDLDDSYFQSLIDP